MKYVTRHSFHNGCIEDIIKRKQWIIDNGLESEIDIFIEKSTSFTGKLHPFTVFAIKSEETAMAYRLTWD